MSKKPIIGQKKKDQVVGKEGWLLDNIEYECPLCGGEDYRYGDVERNKGDNDYDFTRVSNCYDCHTTFFEDWDGYGNLINTEHQYVEKYN